MVGLGAAQESLAQSEDAVAVCASAAPRATSQVEERTMMLLIPPVPFPLRTWSNGVTRVAPTAEPIKPPPLHPDRHARVANVASLSTSSHPYQRVGAGPSSDPPGTGANATAGEAGGADTGAGAGARGTGGATASPASADIVANIITRIAVMPLRYCKSRAEPF
jgi:hypothetical protein